MDDDESRARADRDPAVQGPDRVRLPEVADGYGDDLDEESYRRLSGRRRQRLWRQRVVFGVLVALVLCIGGGAALVYTGHWHSGGDDTVATPTTPACTPVVQAPLLKPADVSVVVLNGTTRRGLASTVADQLRTRGFVVTKVANAAATTGAVTARVTYPTGSVQQARTVAARIPQAAITEDPATAVVTVDLGDDYQQLLGEDALVAPAATPTSSC